MTSYGGSLRSNFVLYNLNLSMYMAYEGFSMRNSEWPYSLGPPDFRRVPTHFDCQWPLWTARDKLYQHSNEYAYSLLQNYGPLI